MQRANFVGINLYSHGKVKLNCKKTCEDETKLNQVVKRNVY